MLTFTMTIPVVILSIRDNEERAFMTQLFYELKDDMLRVAYNITRHQETAEDMVQTAFVRAVLNVDKIMALECCKRRPYMVSIVRRVSLDYITKRDRRSKYSYNADDEELEAAPADDDVLETVIYNAEVEELRQALERLSERDRMLIKLRYQDDLDTAAIADTLNINAASVSALLSRAKRRLAALINGRDDTDE